MERYNGWRNYETWRIKLELVDEDYWIEYLNDGNLIDDDCIKYNLAEAIKEYVEEMIYASSDVKSTLPHGVIHTYAKDYALAFVSKVDYDEISESIIELYNNE